jgi:hypothetical protein
MKLEFTPEMFCPPRSIAECKSKCRRDWCWSLAAADTANQKLAEMLQGALVVYRNVETSAQEGSAAQETCINAGVGYMAGYLWQK